MAFAERQNTRACNACTSVATRQHQRPRHNQAYRQSFQRHAGSGSIHDGFSDVVHKISFESNKTHKVRFGRTQSHTTRPLTRKRKTRQSNFRASRHGDSNANHTRRDQRKQRRQTLRTNTDTTTDRTARRRHQGRTRRRAPHASAQAGTGRAQPHCHNTDATTGHACPTPTLNVCSTNFRLDLKAPFIFATDSSNAP